MCLSGHLRNVATWLHVRMTTLLFSNLRHPKVRAVCSQSPQLKNLVLRPQAESAQTTPPPPLPAFSPGSRLSRGWWISPHRLFHFLGKTVDSTRITYIEPWNSVRRMNNIVPMFSTFSTMASAESQNEGFLLTKILKITPLDQKNVAGHKNTERTSSSWEGLTKKGSRDLPPHLVTLNARGFALLTVLKKGSIGRNFRGKRM